MCIQISILTLCTTARESWSNIAHNNIQDIRCIEVWCDTKNIFTLLHLKNVYYVRAFFSFDWSVSMGPSATGSKKSQMSMLSSCELLTIWKSSNWSLNTLPECSYSNKKEINKSLYQGKLERLSTYFTWLWQSRVEIIPLCNLTVLPHLKCCSVKLPLRVGLIQYLISLCSVYEPRP